MARIVAREGQRSAARSTTAAASQVQRQLSHDAILKGVEAGLVKRAIEQKLLRLDEVHRLIPASTFARKVREGRKLSREEADQVARLLRIKDYAREVFEDTGVAETWLSEANPALGNRVPAELLLTDEGTRAVETLLRRIDYGDYS
ncbi:MAG TPA: antitoxin Xre/MbcA/ParS toxin-binding domain-containing protein [Geminicoccaceae bacterium]|nr:antitoxin Xre/MbcA/ParS toxin-binding domain-containing protein [Geminicoccaceae bacterium]